jgi:hypothetical protein
LFVGTLFWYEKRQLSFAPPPDISFRQLTINSSENPVTSGSISPNGKYLAYVDMQGIHVSDVDSGVTQLISEPADLKKGTVNWEIIDASWFADNTRFLANSHPATENPQLWSSRSAAVWVFSRLNEPPRKLREHAIAWSVSPDGKLISFGTNAGKFGEHENWLMDPNGEHARKLFDTDENSSVGGLGWTPDSQRGLYVRTDAKGDTFWSRDIRGGPPAVFAAASELPRSVHGDVTLLPDGRVIFQVGEPGSRLFKTPVTSGRCAWTCTPGSALKNRSDSRTAPEVAFRMPMQVLTASDSPFCNPRANTTPRTSQTSKPAGRASANRGISPSMRVMMLSSTGFLTTKRS